MPTRPVITPALFRIEEGLPSIRGRRSPNLKGAGYHRSVAACFECCRRGARAQPGLLKIAKPADIPPDRDRPLRQEPNAPRSWTWARWAVMRRRSQLRRRSCRCSSGPQLVLFDGKIVARDGAFLAAPIRIASSAPNRARATVHRGSFAGDPSVTLGVLSLRSAGAEYCNRYCARDARKARATLLPIYYRD